MNNEFRQWTDEKVNYQCILFLDDVKILNKVTFVVFYQELTNAEF